VKKALENNDLLRYIVASDVAGRFMMTANEVDAAARAGTKIKSQVDLNAFIENASDEQKAALGAELGIAEGEWATMSLKRFNQAAAAYRESGKLGQRRAEMKAAEQNKNAYAGEAVGETVDSGKLTVESSADVAKTLKTAENAELTSINGENMSVSGGKSVRFSIDNGNGAPFVAKLTVEEYDVDGKNRAYNLQRIEMSDLQRAQYAQLISENKEKYAYKSDALSVAQLFDFVKRYDEEFKPKSVNPALLNEDGTPKVFYHGTRSQFTTFELQDKPKFGRALGDGFYFTPDYDKAFKFANGLFSKGQDRGGIIMPVYLRMENPYVIEKDADRTKWAKEYNAGKYDGIIDLKNDTYYVENPGQIKSATDNIGTFDGKNKDIRYSKDITPKLSDDASVGLRMEDENGNLVPLRLEGFTDEKGRLIQEKSGDASKGATKRLRKSDRLSPKTFERLKKDGGRVIISDELYEKIVRRSDKATARKLKGRLGYSEKAEARRKEEAELLGRSFKPKESISAEDYVKEIAATEKIQSINPSDVVGALIEIDRLYRVNRDGGKAYRLEVENERLTEQNRELNSQSRENLQSQVDYLAKKLGELKDATFFNAR